MSMETAALLLTLYNHKIAESFSYCKRQVTGACLNVTKIYKITYSK